MALSKELGLRIRALREGLGLTAQEVARLTKLSQPTIWRIEHGHDALTLRNLEAIARVLRVSIRLTLDPRSKRAA